MNDFSALQNYFSNLTKVKTPRAQLREHYMQYPWFRRSMAKKEDSSNITYISILLADCLQNGELIKESDGQFTGGYSVDVYRYNDEVFEFGYQDGKLCDMSRFDGRLY